MKRRHVGLSLLRVALLLASAGTVFGQALPTATGPGSSVRVGGGVSDFRVNYGQVWLGGGQLWVDTNPHWRLGIEAEARWSRSSRDPHGPQQRTYLAGPRLSLAPGRVEPYVKALAGRGTFTFPFHYATGSYFVVAGGGGLDIHRGRWQIRAVDVEYQVWPQFTYGRLGQYGVSAGVSYTILRGASRSVR